MSFDDRETKVQELTLPTRPGPREREPRAERTTPSWPPSLRGSPTVTPAAHEAATRIATVTAIGPGPRRDPLPAPAAISSQQDHDATVIAPPPFIPLPAEPKAASGRAAASEPEAAIPGMLSAPSGQAGVPASVQACALRLPTAASGSTSGASFQPLPPEKQSLVPSRGAALNVGQSTRLDLPILGANGRPVLSADDGGAAKPSGCVAGAPEIPGVSGDATVTVCASPIRAVAQVSAPAGATPLTAAAQFAPSVVDSSATKTSLPAAALPPQAPVAQTHPALDTSPSLRKRGRQQRQAIARLLLQRPVRILLAGLAMLLIMLLSARWFRGANSKAHRANRPVSAATLVKASTPAPAPSGTDSGQPPPPKPPVAGAGSGLASSVTAKIAVEQLVAGDASAAIGAYRSLAESQPDVPAFAAIVTILQRQRTACLTHNARKDCDVVVVQK